MRKAVAVLGFAALMVFASVTAAPAIAIFSADGLGDGFGVLTCTTVGCPGVVQIAPLDPSWQNPALSPQPSAEWVSFAANHGTNTSGVADGTTTTMRYTFTAAINSFLNLSIWADDTAGVVLDGATVLFSPDPGPYPNCATAPIGCTPGNEGIISGLFIAAGVHTIDYSYSQLGGSDTPYGVMYAGDLQPIPEPATLLLLGSALAAAGVVSRRRLSKKSEDKI